jgi:hypothetical protein
MVTFPLIYFFLTRFNLHTVQQLGFKQDVPFSVVHDWYWIRPPFVELCVNIVEILNYLKPLRTPVNTNNNRQKFPLVLTR